MSQFKHEDIDELNSRIAEWDGDDLQRVRNEINALGIRHDKHSPNKVPLRSAIKSKLAKRNGLTSKITRSFPRSGIFLHKGLSRGHGPANPRQAKEWYEPIVEKDLDSLADIVADGQGDLIINALNL